MVYTYTCIDALFPVVLLFQLNSGIPPAGGLSPRGPQKKRRNIRQMTRPWYSTFSQLVLSVLSLSLLPSLWQWNIQKQTPPHKSNKNETKEQKLLLLLLLHLQHAHKRNKKHKIFHSKFLYFLTRHLRGSRVYRSHPDMVRRHSFFLFQKIRRRRRNLFIFYDLTASQPPSPYREKERKRESLSACLRSLSI